MFTAALRSQSSAEAVSTLWNTKSAALFTSTSILPPRHAAAAAAALSQSASEPMSPETHSECSAT